MMLGACVSSSSGGRTQLTVPPAVSVAYSEINMRLALVSEANTDSHCSGAECGRDRAFDLSVMRLGKRLAQAAFEIYPDLNQRIEKFEFIIAEKSNHGSISSAGGTVVIFRGVEKLLPSDEFLAFLIAREMGHVIGRHHDENSATGIMFSVLAAVFIPVTNLVAGTAALAQTTSTVAASTAATSAASYIGSRTVIANYKLDHVHEADAIATNLLDRMGWSRHDISSALIAATRVMDYDEWSNDLRTCADDILQSSKASATSSGSTANGEAVIMAGATSKQVDR